MAFRISERGEGKVGCVLWALVLLIAILIAWKAIPVKLQSAEFYDFMVEQAKFAAGSSGEQIRGRILQKAKELDLPLEAKNLRVERTGARVRINASYVVPLKFPGFTYQWRFDHEIDRPIYSM